MVTRILSLVAKAFVLFHCLIKSGYSHSHDSIANSNGESQPCMIIAQFEISVWITRLLHDITVYVRVLFDWREYTMPLYYKYTSNRTFINSGAFFLRDIGCPLLWYSRCS